MADKTPPPTDPNEGTEAPPNLMPFRAIAGEAGQPAPSPVESNAFNELARELQTCSGFSERGCATNDDRGCNVSLWANSRDCEIRE